jgi:hypothetical protein
MFTNVLKGRSALVGPITAKERVLGLVALVWAGESARFSDYEVQLISGI